MKKLYVCLVTISLFISVFAFKVSANTGNGTISTVTLGSNAVTESWTVTCSEVGEVHLSGVSTPVYYFSVVGSASGTQSARAQADIEYSSDSSEVTFTIESGSTAFIVGDSFAFTSTVLNPPGALTATSGSTIELSWETSTSSGISGYNVYRGTSSGSYGASPINTSSIVTNNLYIDSDAGFTLGTTYYYVVRSVDSSDAESSNSSEVSAAYGELNLWIPKINAPSGSSVKIPVNINNADGLSISNMDVWIDYDAGVIEPTAVESTFLSEGYTFSETHSTPGRIWVTLSGRGTSALKGEGVLFNMIFNVTGADGSVSSLDFVIFAVPASQEEEAVIDASYFGANFSNGSLTVSSTCVQGDLDGDGTVGSSDISSAMQISVGTTTANTCQESAGDIDGDGKIGANDGTMIFYYAANNAWPSLSNIQQSIYALPSSLNVTLPSQISGLVGASSSISLELSDVTGLAAADIVITYDSSILTSTGVSVIGLVTSGFSIEYNTATAGIIKVALASGTALSEGTNEAILSFAFDIKSTEVSPIRLASYKFYDINGRDWERSSLGVAVAPQYSAPPPPPVTVPSLGEYGILLLFLVVWAIFHKRNAYEL